MWTQLVPTRPQARDPHPGSLEGFWGALPSTPTPADPLSFLPAPPWSRFARASDHLTHSSPMMLTTPGRLSQGSGTHRRGVGCVGLGSAEKQNQQDGWIGRQTFRQKRLIPGIGLHGSCEAERPHSLPSMNWGPRKASGVTRSGSRARRSTTGAGALSPSLSRRPGSGGLTGSPALGFHSSQALSGLGGAATLTQTTSSNADLC